MHKTFIYRHKQNGTYLDLNFMCHGSSPRIVERENINHAFTGFVPITLSPLIWEQVEVTVFPQQITLVQGA